ncbi:hypothetical protein M406DRAFT_79874 [Cryphonectria parasitica EP155]|uniref:Enoyl reductase (ER) domain-containing protein n=1 Tax=Cryphonectria parasitica (strain ATCC 38755 / EP155) TaxID=660469 RepID=A0A9P4Y5N4_CRYP1|nr:uncharacterized protein M406DRAFT_79874 [Cryphonectria parasitica EP155]KAF3767424.1 hypothetical protein M406DRAFT_79874 [Cryphonectria parasitica EP155]
MAPSAMMEDKMEPMHTGSSYTKPSTVVASVLHGARDLRLEHRSIDPPAAGELQIAIRSTGICGSDVSYFKKFANGDLCACQPISLGHESSGVVTAIGAQVGGFSIGDRVALEVGVPCGQCGICRKGRYNLCRKMRFRSSAKSFPHFQGTLQEQINHPAVWCHKLPDHISFDAAALLEPLSVAIHAVNRAKPEPGATALVIGAGTVGLLTAAMAQQSGCSVVTICDVDQGRVEYALEHGFATYGYVVPRPLRASSSSSSVSLEGARSLAQDILAVSKTSPLVAPNDDEDEEDDGVDITFECTGKEECMHTALYATKPGGKLIMVGMGTPIQTLPMSVAHLREVDILGIFRYANTYATGIRLLCASKHGSGNKSGKAGGLPSLDNMVTHRFKGLHRSREAFELAGRTADDEGRLVLKVVIEA